MQLLRHFSLVAVLLSAAVNALPTASPQGIADLSALSKRNLDGHQITNCDLSSAILPKGDGTNLLADPDPGLTLTRVVLGRGTQNYTCTDSTSSTIPATAGAKAILYDASCLAAFYPSLLHELPDAVVTISESVEYWAGAIFQKLSQEDIIVGHHYFAPNFSTPVFDFRLKLAQSGIFTGIKDQSVPASEFAALGGGPDEQFGAVDWLRLKAIPSKTVDYKLAYRVHTAGGKAPPTCSGQPAEFTINYSAEYWFYN